MNEEKFTLTFWGVRGGYPTPGPTTVKYGGNTTCFEIRAGPQRVIVDGGTGIIGLGEKILAEHRDHGGKICLILLITHTHHDHTQGFPFFFPTRHPDGMIFTYGPQLKEERLESVLNRAMSPPVFPLGMEELYSHRPVTEVRHGDLIVSENTCQSPQLYHLGQHPDRIPSHALSIHVCHGYHHPRNGILFYRIGYGGKSIVIATDTEGYIGGDHKLIRFSQDADVLVHDSEYDEDEYAGEHAVRQGWGHSTWRMATEVAQKAHVRHLVLTHHSPRHDDAYLETMLQKAQAVFPNTSLAQEGLTLEL